MQQHRSAPVLLHNPLERRGLPASADGIPSTQPLRRELPSGAAAKLVDLHLRRRLLECARAVAAEVVIVVEMKPVSSRQLHQSRDKYVRQFQLISDAIAALGGRINLSGEEGAVGMTVAGGCIELPEAKGRPVAWRESPAFDDYRRVGGELTSNVSWAHGPALRHGAFEVYALIRSCRQCTERAAHGTAGGQPGAAAGRAAGHQSGGARGGEPAGGFEDADVRVELLFSKLYSR